MIIPDFIEKLKSNVLQNDKRYPCYTNRASQIGYAVPELEGCLRKGVYFRTAWDKAKPYGYKSLVIFREGNRQEQAVISDLAEAGIYLINQQAAFEWKEYQISGHLDGVLPVEDQPIPVEIKSMNPFIYDQILFFEDFKKKPWTRAYMAQIQIYMLFKNVDRGIFFLKNKSSGELRQINVQLDYDLAEACIKTAEKINEHIFFNTLPEKINDVEKCRDCQFNLHCCPDMNFEAPLRICDDPDFEKRLKRFFELKESAEEKDSIEKIIKERAKASALETGGELNLLVGEYRLTGKCDSRGAFRLNFGK